MHHSRTELVHELTQAYLALRVLGPTEYAGLDANLERAMMHLQLALYGLGAEFEVPPAFGKDGDYPRPPP